QYDPETRLVYARARYYDSEAGIFSSRDPINRAPLQAPWLHRYAYARANPLLYTDPSGQYEPAAWAQELEDRSRRFTRGTPLGADLLNAATKISSARTSLSVLITEGTKA